MSVFGAQIVWLQLVASLVVISDMAGKLEDLQTGLVVKGEDWLRKELESLSLGALRVVAGELGLSQGGLKADLATAIGNEMSAQAAEVIAPGGKVMESELTCDTLNESQQVFHMI